MNLKKAKAIRKSLRLSGVNSREVVYDLDKRSMALAEKNQLHPHQVTIVLGAECGRKKYKTEKQKACV